MVLHVSSVSTHTGSVVSVESEPHTRKQINFPNSEASVMFAVSVIGIASLIWHLSKHIMIESSVNVASFGRSRQDSKTSRRHSSPVRDMTRQSLMILIFGSVCNTLIDINMVLGYEAMPITETTVTIS